MGVLKRKQLPRIRRTMSRRHVNVTKLPYSTLHKKIHVKTPNCCVNFAGPVLDINHFSALSELRGHSHAEHTLCNCRKLIKTPSMNS